VPRTPPWNLRPEAREGTVLDAHIDALLVTEVTTLTFARRIVMGIEARSKDEREQDRVRRLERERKELEAQRAKVLN
jgi:hypothetical protein